MRAAIYTRVSTTEQASDDATSLEQQAERCAGYATSQGWEVVATFTDAGVSGSKPIEERPAGSKLIKAIEAGEVEAVIVLKVDRFTRSISDSITLKKWQADGIAFASVGESFDTATPPGKMMLNLLMVFAEFERDRIKERLLDGKQGAADRSRDENGRITRWLGGRVPFGWTVNEDTFEVEIDPVDAEAVRQMFALRAEGMSTTKIARHLNSEGFTGPSGKAISGDLVNECTQPTATHYIGKGIVRSLGKGLPKETFIAPALVTRAQFEAAISGGTKVAKVKGGGESRYPYALGSRIKHRHADGTLHGMVGITRIVKVKRGSDEKKAVRWYRCSAARDSKQTCEGLGEINKQQMTSVAADFIESRAIEYVWRKDWQGAFRAQQEAAGRQAAGFDVSEARLEIRRLTGLRDGIYEAMHEGSIEVGAAVEQVGRVEAEIATIQQQIENVQHLIEKADDEMPLPTLDEIMAAVVQSEESDEAAAERRAIEAYEYPAEMAARTLGTKADGYGRIPILPLDVIEAAAVAIEQYEVEAIITPNPDDPRRPNVTFTDWLTREEAA